MADEDDALPTVKNGRLSKPYPIRTRGDVNRARVLPPPVDDEMGEQRAPMKRMEKRAPAPTTDEGAKGGFDYVMKRNKMMRSMGVRGPGRRSAPRTSRA